MQALTGIGSFLGKNAKTVIPGALTGAGFISNWLNARRQRQREAFLQNLAENPAAMAKYAAGFTKPLAAGLKQNVDNSVQAFLGERGLSGTPGISADVEAQALAPFIQQTQQQGFSDAMAALGLMPSSSHTSDLSGTLALLMKGIGGIPGAPHPATSASTPSNQDMGLIFPSGDDSGGNPFDTDSLIGLQLG